MGCNRLRRESSCCDVDWALFSGAQSGIFTALNRHFKAFGKTIVAKALARYIVAYRKL